MTRNSVITSVGGSRIASLDDLDAALRSHKPGDHVSVTWINAGGSHTATVTLAGINR